VRGVQERIWHGLRVLGKWCREGEDETDWRGVFHSLPLRDNNPPQSSRLRSRHQRQDICHAVTRIARRACVWMGVCVWVILLSKSSTSAIVPCSSSPNSPPRLECRWFDFAVTLYLAYSPKSSSGTSKTSTASLLISDPPPPAAFRGLGSHRTETDRTSDGSRC
jgi:hypothetical protein